MKYQFDPKDLHDIKQNIEEIDKEEPEFDECVKTRKLNRAVLLSEAAEIFIKLRYAK